MKKAALIILSAITLVGCARQISLVTWNVGVFDKYGDSRELVSSVLKHLGPDLVAFNELDSCNRRHDTYQLRDVAGRLGYEYHFESAFPYEGGGYGNGVASRRPILKSYRIDLPKGKGYEPRCVAVVETKNCVFASVHLDHSDTDASWSQAILINSWFEAHYNGYGKPVILCGDMNSTPDSKTIQILESRWNRLSPIATTHPSTGKGKCIDYVFALKRARQVELEDAAVLSDEIIKGISIASDHLPIYVKFRY